MAFQPNYKRLGIEDLQSAFAYIFGFLKKNEKSILKNGLGKNPSATFMLGDYQLTLGSNEKNFEKSGDKRQK